MHFYAKPHRHLDSNIFLLTEVGERKRKKKDQRSDVIG